MKFISYIFFRATILLISLIPYSLLYVFSDLLGLVLFKLFRYRRSVIRKNIDYCFPGLSQNEIQQIETGFFKNFTDITMESLKSISLRDERVIRNISMDNIDLLNEYYDRGESVIILAAHYNNWEWGKYLEHFFKHRVVVTIKKLSNRNIDRYISKSRAGSSLILINNMYELGELVKKDDTPKAIVFLIDQNPMKGKKTLKSRFFDKDIDFHAVASDFAKDYGLDCVYMTPERVSRGKYSVNFEALAPSRESSSQELLDQYVTMLESRIRACPQSWMWTHKRFKREIEY